MDILDLSGTIKAKSDQLNVDDMVTGPMMIQVEEEGRPIFNRELKRI